MACSKEVCFERFILTQDYPETEKRKRQAPKDVGDPSKSKKPKVPKGSKKTTSTDTAGASKSKKGPGKDKALARKKPTSKPPAQKAPTALRKRKSPVAASTEKETQTAHAQTQSAGTRSGDPSNKEQADEQVADSGHETTLPTLDETTGGKANEPDSSINPQTTEDTNPKKKVKHVASKIRRSWKANKVVLSDSTHQGSTTGDQTTTEDPEVNSPDHSEDHTQEEEEQEDQAEGSEQEQDEDAPNDPTDDDDVVIINIIKSSRPKAAPEKEIVQPERVAPEGPNIENVQDPKIDEPSQLQLTQEHQQAGGSTPEKVQKDVIDQNSQGDIPSTPSFTAPKNTDEGHDQTPPDNIITQPPSKELEVQQSSPASSPKQQEL